MPKALTPEEKKKRHRAGASKRAAAKARERKAKADGTRQDYDATIRANLSNRAGLSAGERLGLLRASSKRAHGRDDNAVPPDPSAEAEGTRKEEGAVDAETDFEK